MNNRTGRKKRNPKKKEDEGYRKKKIRRKIERLKVRKERERGAYNAEVQLVVPSPKCASRLHVFGRRALAGDARGLLEIGCPRLEGAHFLVHASRLRAFGCGYAPWCVP